ncbi:MAG: spore coat U domain-containing protein [Alphaproteobacteria bacterium]|nr:spore coat U domain-containing protein [Alphaproteobacteria bacterium]
MKRITTTAAGFCLAAALVCSPAEAATCDISTQSVNFGSYDTLDPQPLDGVGSIAVVCDAEAQFTISLSSGSGTYPARRLTSGADELEYNLFTDASRILIWGDGSAGSVTHTASASTEIETIYGRIFPRQNVSAGSYADTIIVTIVY